MTLHFLDTNAVIWLYQGEIDRFSNKAKRVMEENDIFISPFVKLELQYLFEVKRIKKSAEVIVGSLYKDIGLQLKNAPATLLVEIAVLESWTRDPFDRLITSHAKLESAHLLTKDENILKHYAKAYW